MHQSILKKILFSPLFFEGFHIQNKMDNQYKIKVIENLLSLDIIFLVGIFLYLTLIKIY